MRQSMSEALSEIMHTVADTEDIEAALLFGSYARGTASSTSDVDVIFLLRRDRSPHHRLYKRVTVKGVDLDVNLVSASDLYRLLAYPSWQYRFTDARLISVLDEQRAEAIAWLDRTQAWVESSQARTRRIRILRDGVLRLTGRAERIDPRQRGARAFHHALALERSLFMLCELADVFPFIDSNPLETLARRDAVVGAPAEWPLPPGRVGTDEATRAESWKKLRAFLRCSMTAVPGFVDAASDGRDSDDVALALPMAHLINASLDRLCVDRGWSEAPACRWISEALARSSNAQAMRETRLTLWRIIGRGPVVGERRTGKRHEEYDSVRRRLKVIVPTGGCRLPRCTFCRLPELARKSAQIDLTRVVSQRDESLREVAIYTDGSFFDDRELSDADRLSVADHIRGLGVASVVVESLPQLATFDKVARFFDRLKDGTRLTVSVGIQTFDDVVRRVILGTPTTRAAIEQFFEVRARLGFAIRVFLLYGKPLLTLYEDENDVRQSVQELSERLGDGDTVTVNYLNVVSGTQVEVLERAGFYYRRDLCRFRMFVQELTAAGHKFRVAPGCVVVRTCSERPLAEGGVCTNCLEWLTAAENGTYPEAQACLRQRDFAFELPWSVFGDAEDRCQFVLNALQIQRTPTSSTAHIGTGLKE